MIIRKFLLGAATTALALSALGGGAEAGGPLDDWIRPFTAEGVIYNDAPPARIPTTDRRVYVDGDNFSINPVTSLTPAAAYKNVDASGTLGIFVSPTTTYTLNGNATDFDGGIVEGCTTHVEGYITNRPTQVAKDELRATTVATTCP